MPPKFETGGPAGKGKGVHRAGIKKPPSTLQRRARAARPHPGGDPQRPNVGSGKHLEVFWHVDRQEGELLPPRGCLFRKKRSEEGLIPYTFVDGRASYPHLQPLIIKPSDDPLENKAREFVSGALTYHVLNSAGLIHICKAFCIDSWIFSTRKPWTPPGIIAFQSYVPTTRPLEIIPKDGCRIDWWE